MLGRLEKEGTRAVLLQASANAKGQRRAVGDSAASVLTVSCSLDSFNAAALARPPRVIGQIEWGTDGHQCTALFDWTQGAVVQVACASVRVIAELVPTMVVDDDVSPDFADEAVVRVGAVVGYMPSSRVPLTLTTQVRIDDAGEGLIRVPAFASALTVVGPTPLTLLWLAGDAPTLELGAVDVPANIRTSNLYRVPGPASYLRVTGVADQLFNFVWSLAL